jgi:TonB family protein
MRLPAAARAFICVRAFVCLSAFSQQTQTPLPEGVYRIGNGVTPPQVLSKVDPQYSEEARIAKLTGTVSITLVVGEDGDARNVRALTSPGLSMDDAAIAAVSKWRFKPGLKDGMPVPVSVDVEVQFRLITDPGAWAPFRVVFDSPEGTARPVLTSAPYPPMYSATGETGSVTLSFHVDQDGAATNLHIEKSSGPAAETEVIRIVRGWQFRPGVKDGQPVSVRCTMEFAKGNHP